MIGQKLRDDDNDGANRPHSLGPIGRQLRYNRPRSTPRDWRSRCYSFKSCTWFSTFC